MRGFPLECLPGDILDHLLRFTELISLQEIDQHHLVVHREEITALARLNVPVPDQRLLTEHNPVFLRLQRLQKGLMNAVQPGLQITDHCGEAELIPIYNEGTRPGQIIFQLVFPVPGDIGVNIHDRREHPVHIRKMNLEALTVRIRHDIGDNKLG
ncbi:hypothetical protein D3C73_1082210 [compost metagenome]